jgi:copper homeostasis protein
MTLEIIVTGADEAVAAERAGATQLELVADRERGGLTPLPAVIEGVVRAVAIPVHVIVRPHDDGFQYDAPTRATMVDDARRAASLGAAAIVIGALDANRDVELELLCGVHDAARLPITFHRAFDDTRDLFEAYDALARASGVTRVLTSGSARSAWEGRATLQLLHRRDGPSILAGGGITADNVADLLHATGIREVHVGSGARTGSRLNPSAIERIAQTLNTFEN